MSVEFGLYLHLTAADNLATEKSFLFWFFPKLQTLGIENTLSHLCEGIDLES